MRRAAADPTRGTIDCSGEVPLPRPGWFPLLLAGALVACNGDGSRVAPGTEVPPWVDPTTDTEPCDTGCDPSPYFEVAYLTWQAYFGYDARTGEIVPVWTPYGAIEPAFDILLGEPRWEKTGFDIGQTDAYCLIQLPLADGARPDWVPFSMWHGVGYAGDPPIATCGRDGYELDPWSWGDDPIATVVGFEYDDDTGALVDWGTWGAALGDLSPDAARIIASSVAPEDVPYIFGGALAVPMLNGGLDYDVYSLGYVLDENDAVRLGVDGTLDAWLADEVRRPDGGVVSAFYNVNALYIYLVGP